jgi:histidinol-phosphate phosphatase family protein
VNRALFLDRDGTLIEDPGYLRDPDLVRLLPSAAASLAALQQEGWQPIIVSNQSGVARGLISIEQAQAVHERFLDLMRQAGVTFVASYFCPHAPDAGCECRKPSPFLVREAASEHSLDLAQSWMIGDREDDILCGRNAGCSTIWLRNEKFSVDPALPDVVANNWDEIRSRLRTRQCFR